MKTIAEKLVTVITNMKGLINKLPNSKLKEYVVSKVGNLDYLHNLIGKVTGATIAKIPQKFRKAIFSGLLVYISVKGLNKLLGVKEGTVEGEMAKPEGPGDQVTEKLESISKPTIDSADIKTAEDLNLLVKNNDKKKYAVEYAGFLKDEYPCLQTFLDAGKFEVIAVTEEKALFTINGEEYYNDQTGGIYKTSTEEIFECL
jgi:hypothetical protein